MRIMSVDKCKEIDRYTIEEVGIPGLVLMENAAGEVCGNIINYGDKFLIFCGNGNNGGDGLAIARKLLIENKDVTVAIVNSADNYSKDFLVNLDILKKLTNNIIYIKEDGDIESLKNRIEKYDVVVDCIFGVGLNRPLNDFYIKLINNINKESRCIVSVDVPSGLNANSGEIMGASIVADITYTFEVIKRGFIEYKALSYLGRVEVLKIGIPEFVKKINSDGINILDKKDYKEKLLKRNVYGHKGSYGRVAILAGSKGFTGAAYISTEACVKSGVGLTTLVTKNYVQDKLSSKLVEAMTSDIEDQEASEEVLKSSKVIAIGPGISKEKVYVDTFMKLISYGDKFFVVDAGALDIVKDNENIINGLRGRAVLTPHPGEMARLIGRSIDYVEKNRIDIAKNYAKEKGIIILLKGYNTVITDGDDVYINNTGNSKMASGGMGDCLTGIIAGLLAQGHSLLDSALLGAYIHGLAGEEASIDKYSTTASEVIENIPKVMNSMNKC